MQARSFYLLAYDMRNDRRRAKLARLMESLGARVQGSVFEIYLTPRELQEMLGKAKKLMLEKEDSIRVYFICEDCRKKVKVLGQGTVNRPPEVLIV